MTPLRFSMLTATLLAFAATVHGQTPSEPTKTFPVLPTWSFSTDLQQGMQILEKLRNFCAGQTCEKGVCGMPAVSSPGCCKLGVCATGAAGSVKCCQTVRAPASCCCAKACACCESCKAKKTEADLAKFEGMWMVGGHVLPNPPPVSAYLPPLPTMPTAGPVGITLPRPSPYPAPIYYYIPRMMSPSEVHTGSLMLGAGINSDVGVCGGIVTNERNFENIARQQADRDLKIAEFYQRTGHSGAAQFYYELVARRYGPVLTPMPAPAPYPTVQVHAVPTPPMANGVYQAPLPCPGPTPNVFQYVYPPAPPMPVPPPPPMPGQVVRVQTIMAQPMVAPPPPAVVHVADCVAAAPKHAHLVTPDLEAHCMRMTHQGDKIILEGDVILVNKKHAQPIRIEAQRVIINMKDGSVTVEGAGTTSGFGVTRTSAVVPIVERVNTVGLPGR